MKATALALAAGLVACTSTALEPGEQLYREGDLRGAIDLWRESGDSELAPRIALVESEAEARADAYVAAARAAESEGRLAESILDYRLALDLRPSDAGTLAHVQVLARQLVTQRASLLESYREVRSRNDLPAAREALARLRNLDPYEPAYEIEERRLRADINAESQRRRARIRQQQAAQVEQLIEAGRVAFGEEKLETALDLWRRALLIDPENERLQAYIARAEQQLDSLQRLRREPDGD